MVLDYLSAVSWLHELGCILGRRDGSHLGGLATFGDGGDEAVFGVLRDLDCAEHIVHVGAHEHQDRIFLHLMLRRVGELLEASTSSSDVPSIWGTAAFKVAASQQPGPGVGLHAGHIAGTIVAAVQSLSLDTIRPQLRSLCAAKAELVQQQQQRQARARQASSFQQRPAAGSPQAFEQRAVEQRAAPEAELDDDQPQRSRRTRRHEREEQQRTRYRMPESERRWRAKSDAELAARRRGAETYRRSHRVLESSEDSDA